jgi:hypothetical protein
MVEENLVIHVINSTFHAKFSGSYEEKTPKLAVF